MENYLLEEQVKVQLELASQKLMAEIKTLKDDMRSIRDDISAISKNMKNSSIGGFPSSPPSRPDFQVSPPNNVAPSNQDPYGGFGNEGFQRPQQSQQPQYQQQQFQQPQQFQPRQAPPQVQMDQNQGGFTGAAVAETTRGRGTSLPSNLTMDKVFYCGGGKR